MLPYQLYVQDKQNPLRTDNSDTGRKGTVGIANHYGLKGLEIESLWGQGYPQPSRRTLWSTQPPTNGYGVSVPGVKRPGRGLNHPPHRAPRIKKSRAATLKPACGSSDRLLGEL